MVVDRIVSAGEVHRYHFTLTKGMKDEIKAIGRIIGKNMHDTIVFGLQEISPVMIKWHLMNEEADGKVEKVNWDTKAHVKLDFNLFKRIKLLQAQMTVYSIAIIVRRMLALFIKYFRRGGLEGVRLLVARFCRFHFRKYKKSKIFDKRKIQTQLSRFTSNTVKYIISLNCNYQLLTTKINQ